MNNDFPVIVFVLGTFILLLFAFFIIIFLITHKKKQFQHLLEKQAMEGNYQNQLLLSRLEVQELSLKHFSEEIHDNIGQLLSLVKMHLYNIKNTSGEPEIVKKANTSNELLGKAITDLRNISHTLNSTYIDTAGLEAAIQKELDYICSAKDLKCSFHKTGDEYELDSEREVLVFRIVQEAIGNAIKHGAPRHIKIFLHYSADAFKVIIEDDGKGFDIKHIDKPGLGLNNMNVRANLMRGKLYIKSNDKGTAVILEIKK